MNETVACLICLRPSAEAYHARCLKALLATTKLPVVAIAIGEMEVLGMQMVRHTCFSGVQRKLSVSPSDDRAAIVPANPGRYILKPQSRIFPAVPENEHLTMRLAEHAGVATPPNGLFRMRDGSFCYIVKRFDRTADGRKFKLEDFCQLADLPPRDKYSGSAERCAQLVRRYGASPLLELARFYRLVLFSWWTGNEDLHRKNLALLEAEPGEYRLSPAFDLVSSALYLPDRELALPVQGKDRHVTRRDWLEFGKTCGLPERAVAGIHDEVIATHPIALELLGASPLPPDLAERYAAILDDRTARLRGSPPDR
ncbi:MAG: HipA domain-containing protein [Candidatus Sericytochromatia bacterium]|nr:HipA domain-containing protein [Candidatus Tanganyikabacteria bacterium]